MMVGGEKINRIVLESNTQILRNCLLELIEVQYHQYSGQTRGPAPTIVKIQMSFGEISNIFG